MPFFSRGQGGGGGGGREDGHHHIAKLFNVVKIFLRKYEKIRRKGRSSMKKGMKMTEGFGMEMKMEE